MAVGDDICRTIRKRIEVRIKSLTITNWSWYSTGGIFTKPSILGGIGVGDAYNGHGSNAEAVLPLDVLWGEMAKFADTIVKGVTNQGDINVKIDLDGQQVAKSVITNINKQTRLNGYSPLR